jgi:hypothetical protein
MVVKYGFLHYVYRLRVFENKILRRTFETRRDENGAWRRLHNKEIPHLFRSPKIG